MLERRQQFHPSGCRGVDLEKVPKKKLHFNKVLLGEKGTRQEIREAKLFFDVAKTKCSRKCPEIERQN